MRAFMRPSSLSLRYICLWLCVGSFWACTEVAPTNPFDPQTPESQQAKATLKGLVEMPDDERDLAIFNTAAAYLLPSSLVRPAETLCDDENVGEAAYRTDLSATSDDGARFEFQEVTEADYQLVICVIGFEPAQQFTSPKRGETIDFVIALRRIDPSVSQSGVIGRVRLEGAADDGHGSVSIETQDKPYQTTSVRTGDFQLPLPPGTYTLSIARDGYLTQSRPNIVVQNGEMVALDEIILSRDLSGRLSGRLLSDIDNFEWPLRSEVKLVGQGDSRSVTPNAAGEFTIELLQPGIYGLEVIAEGHNRYATVIDLSIGEVALDDIYLFPQNDETAEVLRGFAFLGTADNPVGHFGINIQAFVGADLVATSQTNDAGQFAFSTLRTDHRLVFSRPGFQSVTLDVQWNRESNQFEAAGEALAMYRGAVLPADLNTSVTGTIVSPIGGIDYPSTAVIHLIGDGQTRQAAPNADGAFEFLNLRPGLYGLDVRCEGHLAVSRLVQLAPGANEIDVVNLTPEFDAPDTDPTLRGRVQLDDVADDNHFGITIEAYAEAQLIGASQSARSGDYALTLPRRAVELRFSKAGYQPVNLALDWSADTASFVAQGGMLDINAVRLVADTSATVQGQLTSSTPEVSWADIASVTLIGAGQTITVAPDAVGRFDFVDLRPGEYGLEVTADGHLPLARNLIVESGANELAAFQLIPEVAPAQRDPIMRGQVGLADQDAQSAFGITVQAFVGPDIVASGQTNRDGQYGFTAQRLDHRLVFSRVGYLTRELAVRWNENNAQFEAQGEALSQLQGVALAPDLSGSIESQLFTTVDGYPWAEAVTATLIGDNQVRIVQPDAFGNLNIRDLRPGLYGLEIAAEGHLPSARLVEVASGVNAVGVIQLIPEYQAPPPPPVMRGFVFLGDQDGAEANHFGVTVQAFIADDLVATAQTTPAGQYAFTAARTNYRLVFTKEGYDSRSLDVVWSDDTERFEAQGEPLATYEGVTLPADLSASVSGQVTTTIEGFGWAETTVISLIGDGGERLISPGADGDFEFLNLRPGLYGLEIAAEGHLPFSRLLELNAGPNALDVIALVPEFEVPESPVMRGRAYLADQRDDGDNHFGITVQAFVAEDLVATTTTNRDGLYAFPAARTNYRLEFTMPGYLPRVLDVTWSDRADPPRFEAAGDALDQYAGLVLAVEPLADRDGDGVIDPLENCLRDPNPLQNDLDGDGIGDACDDDRDGDGLINGLDNCPDAHNPMQEDVDGDGLGSACNEGTFVSPFRVGCGVRNQRLNTFGRSDTVRGSCGGGGSPEVVYVVSIGTETVVEVSAVANFASALHLMDENGRAAGCVVGAQLTIAGRGVQGIADNTIQVEPGTYRLVVDGLAGSDNAGPVTVDIRSTACEALILHTADTAVDGARPYMGRADLNGDGLNDLISMDSANGEIQFAFNIGNGEFGPLDSYLIRGIDISLLGPYLTSDLDGDGDDDVLLLYNDGGDRHVATLMSQGDGTFGLRTAIDVEGAFLELHDWNDDGHLDLLMAHTFGTGRGQLRIHSGDGAGNFSELPIRIDTASFLDETGVPENQPIHLFAHVDVDGDGSKDLLMRSGRLNAETSVFVLIATEAGYAEADGYPMGDALEDIVWGDLNGDGAIDLVAPVTNEDAVSIAFGTGDGGFQPNQVLQLNRSVDRVRLQDLNGDGLVDLLIETGTLDQPFWYAIGDGYGRFGDLNHIQLRGARTSPVLMDANGDGLTDVVGFDSSMAGTTIRSVMGRQYDERRYATRFLVGDGPIDTLADDINQDGIKDLMVVNQNSRDISVLVGLGDDRFSSQTRYAATGFVHRARIADVNADGRPDLLYVADLLRVRLNTGGGRFAAEQSIAAGIIPRALAIGDFDSDGQLDVATANYQEEGISILAGNGDGTFAAPNHVVSGDQTVAIETLDLNADGHLDLVTLNQGSRALHVHLGVGNGAFEPFSEFAVGGQSTAFCLDDFNLDGNLDVAATNRADDTVTILLGLGDGRFEPGTDYPVGPVPSDITCTDLNQDGRVDLLVSNENDDHVTLLSGNGTGSFLSSSRLAGRISGRTNTVADFNNDGALDFASAGLGNEVVVNYAKRRLPTGAAPLRAQQAACPPLAFDDIAANAGEAIEWYPEVDNFGCAIERLDIQLTTAVPVGAGAAILRTPLADYPLNLNIIPTGATVIAPEFVAQLARLEGHPLIGGPWQLLTEFEADTGTLRVNQPPSPNNPFAELGAPFCDPNADQSVDADSVCRLQRLADVDGGGNSPTAELSGAAIGAAGDQDVFLIEGPWNGGFLPNQSLEVNIQSVAPNAALNTELKAFRARSALAVAELVEPGHWRLRYRVPRAYSERFFTVTVSGATPVQYDISVRYE